MFTSDRKVLLYPGPASRSPTADAVASSRASRCDHVRQRRVCPPDRPPALSGRRSRLPPRRPPRWKRPAIPCANASGMTFGKPSRSPWVSTMPVCQNTSAQTVGRLRFRRGAFTGQFDRRAETRPGDWPSPTAARKGPSPMIFSRNGTPRRASSRQAAIWKNVPLLRHQPTHRKKLQFRLPPPAPAAPAAGAGRAGTG